jgi:hypothetical protein
VEVEEVEEEGQEVETEVEIEEGVVVEGEEMIN